MSIDHKIFLLAIHPTKPGLVDTIPFSPMIADLHVIYEYIKKVPVTQWALTLQGDSFLSSLGNSKTVRWKEMTSCFLTRLMQKFDELSPCIQCRHSVSYYRECLADIWACPKYPCLENISAF